MNKPTIYTQQFFADSLNSKVQNMAALLGGKDIVMREFSFAAQIVNSTPKVKECDLTSILNAVFNIAGIGLTLNPALNYAYIIPMKGRAVLMPSYQGFCKLITDGGIIKSMESRVIYENDTFEYELGDNQYIKHIPTLEAKGAIKGAYSIAYLNDGSKRYEIMPISDIYEVRNTSISYSYWINNDKKGDCIWNTWESEMCRKTVIKRHFKQLPKSGSTEQQIVNALQLESIDYGVSQNQLMYLESMIHTSAYDADQKDMLLNKVDNDLSLLEYNNILKDLQQNQLDPVTQTNYASQTDIAKHLSKISGDNRKQSTLL